METHAEIAEAKFRAGYNCAQSVLFSFCEKLGLDNEMALKLSCGLGAGMGRQGEICGAVSGGVVVLGLKFGRGKNDTSAQTDLTYSKIREFMNLFSAKHRSCLCRELLNGCDLRTPDGQSYYINNEYFNLICRPCVRDAAALVENMIASR